MLATPVANIKTMDISGLEICSVCTRVHTEHIGLSSYYDPLWGRNELKKKALTDSPPFISAMR